MRECRGEPVRRKRWAQSMNVCLESSPSRRQDFGLLAETGAASAFLSTIGSFAHGLKPLMCHQKALVCGKESIEVQVCQHTNGRCLRSKRAVERHDSSMLWSERGFDVEVHLFGRGDETSVDQVSGGEGVPDGRGRGRVL